MNINEQFEKFFGGKKESPQPEPVQVSPEVEAQIEKEPVSDLLKTRRLAGEMLKKLRENDPEAVDTVEFVDDEEKAA